MAETAESNRQMAEWEPKAKYGCISKLKQMSKWMKRPDSSTEYKCKLD